MRKLLAGLVVLLGVGGLAYWGFMPKTRFILGLAVVSDEEALLVTRRNEDNATYRWVELHHKTKGQQWSVDTQKLDVWMPMGSSNIVSDQERIYLLLEDTAADDPKEYEIWALNKKSGEQVWKTSLKANGVPIKQSLYLQGDQLIAILGELETTVHALDIKTGGLRWKTETTERFQPTTILNDHLYLRSSYQTTTIRLTDGKVLQSLAKNTCWLGDSVLVWEDDTLSQHGLNGEGAPRVLVNPTDARIPYINHCWRYKENIVLMGDDHPNIIITALHEKTKEIVWSLTLKNKTDVTRDPKEWTEAPRFIPRELTDGGANNPIKGQLSLLDLEKGEIKEIESPEILLSNITHVGSHWLLVDRYRTLLLLDDKTGSLRAAWTANWELGKLGPASIKGDMLWLPGESWGSPSSLPWFIFSLSQSKALSVRGDATLRDETSTWAAYFAKAKSIGEPSVVPQSLPAMTQPSSLP